MYESIIGYSCKQFPAGAVLPSYSKLLRDLGDWQSVDSQVWADEVPMQMYSETEAAHLDPDWGMNSALWWDLGSLRMYVKDRSIAGVLVAVTAPLKIWYVDVYSEIRPFPTLSTTSKNSVVLPDWQFLGYDIVNYLYESCLFVECGHDDNVPIETSLKCTNFGLISTLEEAIQLRTTMEAHQGNHSDSPTLLILGIYSVEAISLV